MKHSRFTRAGRLQLRRFAALLLLMFVVSFASGTIAQLLHSFVGVDVMAHSDGAPCPDPTDDDHPCGPTCPCVCCHAQIAVPDVQFYHPSAEWLPAFTSVNEQFRDDLQPKDVAFRIFHPPRV